MAGRAVVARILCAVALFALAFMLTPHRVGAQGEAVITSDGPLTQVLVSTDLNCQVAYRGDANFEFFPGSSTTGSCGTFLAVGGTLYGPAFVPSGSFSSYTAWTSVSQSTVAGGGTRTDPFRISTVVDASGAALRLEEIDSYAVGSQSYRTEVRITNLGPIPAQGVVYRAGDCYLQENDTGFGRVDGGAPACIVAPGESSRIEQWLPITVGSRFMESSYSDVYARIDTQQQLPDTCSCDFAVDNGAGLSWPVNVGPGQTVSFIHETFFSPVGRGPVTQSLRSSVPDPTQITLDPIVVVQSVALTAGVIVLVPFPSALFNNTLEENYAEVMGWLARLRAWAGRVWGSLRDAMRRRTSGRPPLAKGSTLSPPSMTSNGGMSFLVAGPPPPLHVSGIGPQEPEAIPDRPPDPAATLDHPATDPWRSPLGIAGFVLLTALLYAFLDPTFGISLESLATLAGLAIGLFVILIAYGLPLVVLSRADGFALTVRALPATLLVGVLCVLVSRFADFQPGYLYGLIVGFFFAHGSVQPPVARAKAVAAGASLAVAFIAWVALALLRGAATQGSDLSTALLEAAMVTIVVAGLENAVFAMLPLRFMPGAQVFAWNRRVWVVLMALGLFGFVHVLLNPAAGAGYLADTTRTSFFTLIVLLGLFGLASVLFWAYFRFRPHHAAAPPGKAAG
jgi:hypothetical protein